MNAAYSVSGARVLGKVEEAIEKVKGFLDKMGVKYVYDEENKVIIAPYKIHEREFLVFVLFSDNWVTTAARIVNLSELPPNLDKERFFARLLTETFYLSEVTYGLTKNGDVVAHAETHVDALDYENFRVEFHSVVAGIAYFIENIEPELPAEAKGGPLYV